VSIATNITTMIASAIISTHYTYTSLSQLLVLADVRVVQYHKIAAQRDFSLFLGGGVRVYLTARA
jgi:hypothetical protein